MPEKHAALTTLGFTISLHFFDNFLAQEAASPAYPQIEAPTPVGTIKTPILLLSLSTLNILKLIIYIYHIIRHYLSEY